jgi:hypothetical protein
MVAQRCSQMTQPIVDPNRPSSPANEVRFVTATIGLCVSVRFNVRFNLAAATLP